MSLFQKGFLFKLRLSTINDVYTFLRNKPLFYYPKNTALYYYCTQTDMKQNYYYSYENKFARTVLENIPAYSNMLWIPTTEYGSNQTNSKTISPEDLSLEELCLVLKSICNTSDESEEIYEIFNAVKTRCHEMDDEQLKIVFQSLSKSPIFLNQKILKLQDLCTALDKECLRRWKTWTLPKVFYFIDLWYSLGIAKRSDFVFYSTSKLLRKPQRLSAQQVVQLLFYINVLRTTTKDVSMYDLECKFVDCIKQLSITEIGVAVMGFFKTENVMHNETLLNCIIDKTISEIKDIPEITLACILKILRYSLMIPLWHRIYELLDAVEGELPRLSLLCSVHVSLLTTKPQIIHEGVLNKVSQKLVDTITTCRLKDMEKVMFPLAQLNFNPNTSLCIHQLIIEELSKDSRKDEITGYPKTFIALVHYLCLKGIIVENFINKVLDKDFICSAYGKSRYMYGRELLYIDSTVELECPSYSGSRLPADLRNYLSRRYAQYLPNAARKLTNHHVWHLEVKETAELIFGKEFVIDKHLLPNHPRGDIIIHLDDEKKPQSLENLKSIEDFTGSIKSPGSNCLALVIGSKNMFLFETNLPNGETISKLRQLKILGFKPVLISGNDWPKNDTFGKIEHLKKVISTS